jgi:hypothetical protein
VPSRVIELEKTDAIRVFDLEKGHGVFELLEHVLSGPIPRRHKRCCMGLSDHNFDVGLEGTSKCGVKLIRLGA